MNETILKMHILDHGTTIAHRMSKPVVEDLQNVESPTSQKRIADMRPSRTRLPASDMSANVANHITALKNRDFTGVGNLFNKKRKPL